MVRAACGPRGNSAPPGRSFSIVRIGKNCTMALIRRHHRRAADQLLLEGTKQYLSQASALTVGSQKMTPADIIALLQHRIDVAKATDDAAAALAAARLLESNDCAKSASFVASFKRLIVAMFTASPDLLAAFGLSAPKTGKRTVATKADALKKSEETRKARHTMGKKQKQQVKAPLPTPKA